MSLSSSRRNETWVPAPLGVETIVAAAQTIRRADRWELAVIGLFALIGLTATLIAVVAFGPTFDYGAVMAAAG